LTKTWILITSSIFTKTSICDRNYDFWQKNSIFDKNLDFNNKFDFYKNFDLWQKFRFLTKISIFTKTFDFWQKTWILTKFVTDISIFDKNFFYRVKRNCTLPCKMPPLLVTHLKLFFLIRSNAAFASRSVRSLLVSPSNSCLTWSESKTSNWNRSLSIIRTKSLRRSIQQFVSGTTYLIVKWSS